MRVNEKLVGQVARRYCEKFPATPSRTLARKLMADEPVLFYNESQACCAVRLIRGKIGNTHRKQKRGSIVPMREAVIPDSELENWTIHALPGGLKWFVASDIHVEYHDRKAIEIAVGHAKRVGCNAVLLNGDVIDHYALSRWDKDPRRKNFPRELERTGQLLDYINAQLDPEVFWWKQGNHEQRFEHFMQQRCAEFLGVPAFEMQEFMGLADKGVTMIHSNHMIQCGQLCILHGHEWGKGMVNPVNPARGAFLRTIECTLVGHQHRTSHHAETAALGRPINCWSLGCLCQMHPDYAVLNKWNQGFGILDTTIDSDWHMDNLRILNGKVF